MGFTIPNEGSAAFPDQAEPDAVDLDILVAGLAGRGVVSGCEVTAQATPDMTVAVAAGVIRNADGTTAAVAAGNVTITTADATNPRFDLIVASSAGVKSATAGTPAASPVFPSASTNIALAAVYVPANDTTIETDHITDKRVVLAAPVPEVLAIPDGGTALSVVPGYGVIDKVSSATTINTIYYTPVVLRETIHVDTVGCRVTGGAAAGRLARIGLYETDAEMQPTALIAEGEVDCATTGAKTVSVDVDLAPGRYLIAFNNNHASLTFIRVRLLWPWFDPSTTDHLAALNVSATYGALADPGLAWNTLSASTTSRAVTHAWLNVTAPA